MSILQHGGCCPSFVMHRPGEFGHIPPWGKAGKSSTRLSAFNMLVPRGVNGTLFEKIKLEANVWEI